jgi:UDP-N-acetylglucosamine 2-epimerase
MARALEQFARLGVLKQKRQHLDVLLMHGDTKTAISAALRH